MKFKTGLVLLLLVSMMLITFSVGVMADGFIGEIVLENTVAEQPYTVKTTTGDVSFYFEPVGEVTSKRIFTAVVLKYGVSVSDFLKNDSADDVAAIGQSSVSEGKVKFNVNLYLEPSGMHNIIVSYAGAMADETYRTLEFTYINPEKLDDGVVSVISRINECIKDKNAAGIAEILKTEDIRKISELYVDRIHGCTDNQRLTVGEMLVKNKAFAQDNGKITYSDLIDFISKVNECFAIAEMNMGENVEDIKDALEFYNDNYYKLDLTNELFGKYNNEAYQYMLKKPVNELSDVEKIVKFALLKTELSHMNYTLVYDKIDSCKNDFDGIDTNKFDKIKSTDSFGKYVLDGISACSSLESLTKLINDYTESSGGNFGSGGGPGGGSGGGGIVTGTSTTVNVDTTVIQQTAQENENTVLFPDLDKSHWAYTGIEYLYGKGAINGYEDGNFVPENTVTRAEFVTMAIKLFEISPEETATINFSDVNETDWFYDNVRSAVSSGLVMGDADGRFRPDDNITRQEIATILNRYIDKKEIVLKAVSVPVIFEDADEIAGWAFESVARLQQAGIIKGDINSFFNPEANATRAESAVMLYRLMTAETQTGGSADEK